MLGIDPLAVGFALLLIVGFVLIVSRYAPEEMLHHLWRYDGPLSRPSPKVREDDDVRFNWGQHEPGAATTADHPGPPARPRDPAERR